MKGAKTGYNARRRFRQGGTPMNLNTFDRTHPRAGRRVRLAALLGAVTLTVGLSAGFAIPKTTYVFSDGGVQTSVVAFAGQLDAAAERAGLVLEQGDYLVSRQEGDVVRSQVQRAPLLSYDTVTEPIPYETQRRENPALPTGAEVLVQPGAEGARALTYQNRTQYGETTRTLVDIRQAAAPTDEVVEYGTRRLSPLSVTADAIVDLEEDGGGGGVITTVSGQALPFSRALTVKATAYTTERQSWKLTATGTTARVGAIAVDPKVIPYGTRMYIQSADGSIVYGVATAEDCGGAIKGNKIDLFFDSYDACIQFGVRTCTVYILE